MSTTLFSDTLSLERFALSDLSVIYYNFKILFISVICPDMLRYCLCVMLINLLFALQRELILSLLYLWQSSWKDQLLYPGNLVAVNSKMHSKQLYALLECPNLMESVANP